MKNMISVSVAISTYNGEKYIIDQLQSLMGQTYQPKEIIIADDCSSDGTVNLINQYVLDNKLQNLIYVYQNNSQVGVRKSFELATARCTGNIVFYCDQDDVWRKDKIEKMVCYFRDNDVVAAFCNAIIVDENLKSQGITQWERIKYSLNVDLVGHYVYQKGELIPELLKHNVITGMCLAIRKDVVAFDGIPDGTLHDSWLAWISTVNGKVVADNSPLVYYRQHSSNVVGANSKISKEKFMEYKKIRIRQLIQLINRFSAIFEIIKQTSGFENYYCRFEEAINFNLGRVKTLKYKKGLPFYGLLKLSCKGLYKKYTEDNMISFFKDAFALLQ